MSDAVDFIEDTWDAATDLVSDVGGAILDAAGDLVSFVVDEVIDPVMTTVGNVIDAAMDDPLKTIAQVAAIATGNAWALPLIEGADVAIAGGDIGDVLEATAKAYVVQEVGSYVGKAAGAYAGEAAATAEASATTQKMITDAVTSGVRNATIAVVQGQDPLKALVTGGVTAGTAAALGKVPGFTDFAKSNPAAAGAISAGLGAALSKGNVTAAALTGAISAAGIVKDMIKEFDPQNGTANAKLDPTQTAIITDVLMGTASAAITGGNPSNVVKAALLKAGSKALGDMVTGTFKESSTATTSNYEKVAQKSEALEKNQASQEQVVTDYNNLKSQLEIRIDKEAELNKAANTAIDTYNATKNKANYDAAIAAKTAAEEYSAKLSTDFANTYRPKLDEYSKQLTTLQGEHTTLVTGYTESMDGFTNAIDKFKAALDPIYFNSNRAFVEAMNPGFNADEYRKLNGLGADVDVYDHFLGEGQFKGLPINNDAAKALATGDAKGAAVDKAASEPPAESVFDGSKYASSAAAQKAAAAMGMGYFTAPDGNTYKILTDSETKDKIKSASSFGEAFTMARKTLGSGATFEWTNPETGKTSSFTTQTKEEAASSANAGSLVKVNDAVTSYVTDKILGNVTDYKNFNPADLTKAEYKQFINAYLNASDNQRQQMLKGADQMTFGVIANVLKEAPDAIKAQATAPAPFVSVGNIQPSDYTNYLQVIKTGVNTAAADITGVAVRGLQVFGKTIGADTPTLDSIQKLLTEGKDTQMSKLVGNEKVIAGGIASGIESAMSWFVGGPIGSIASLGAVAANNAWIEGSSAVIDSRGNSYANAAEAKANGVFTYRNLTTEENAMRTAIMTSLEIAGEAVGVPGMSKIMQGVPVGQGIDAVVAGIKRTAAGLGNEQLSELATTTAQMAADKFTSFGLNQNATWSDYAKALQDTALATTVAVGTSGSISTALNNMRTANAVVRDENSITATPLAYNSVVAKDANGQNVTLAELLTANSIASFSDPTSNADLAKLTPTVDLRSVVNLGDMTVKLGDIMNGVQTSANTTDVLSESAVAEIFRVSDFIPDDNTVKQFVGVPATTSTFTNINSFIDNNKLDAKEAMAIAKKEGITLTEAQAQQYVQQGDEAALSAKLASQLDPTSTTYEEAKAFFTERGYVPTFEEVNKFVTQSPAAPTTTDVTSALKVHLGKSAFDPKYDWDGDGKVDLGDVLNLQKASLGKETSVPAGSNTVWGQSQKFISEADAAKGVGEYVNPRQVTFDEAKKYLTDQGYNPTDAEVNRFVGQVNEQEQAANISAWTDPRMVDKGEAEAAYAALGLKRPTADDVQKLVGQYSESDLAGKAEAYLPTARYNSVLDQLDKLSVGASQDVLNAIDTVKKDFTGQVKDLGFKLDEQTGQLTNISQQVSDLSTKVGDVETNILTKMADYEKAGVTRDEALSKAIGDVAKDLGTTKEDLLKQIGTTETTLKDQVSGVETSLGQKITDSQDAVLKELGLAKTGLSEEIAATKRDLGTQITDVESNILSRVEQYENAGIARDEALGLAINDVATQLGTTRTDILTQIGQTEKSLSDQIGQTEKRLGTQIGTLQETVGTKGTQVTQQDLDLVTRLEQQGAYDARLDYNNDKKIDQNDRLALENAIKIQQGLPVDSGYKFEPGTGTKWSPTGIFGEMATNQAITQKAIADAAADTQAKAAAEAAATRAAAAKNAANQARLGNVNTLMQMLGQAQDTTGQQVTVKAADPTKIGYIYDWNSIFANPSQEKMFASPYGGYAKGGVVGDDLLDVNDELLKILRG